jgi:hypothetical protein
MIFLALPGRRWQGRQASGVQRSTDGAGKRRERSLTPAAVSGWDEAGRSPADGRAGRGRE